MLFFLNNHILRSLLVDKGQVSYNVTGNEKTHIRYLHYTAVLKSWNQLHMQLFIAVMEDEIRSIMGKIHRFLSSKITHGY